MLPEVSDGYVLVVEDASSMRKVLEGLLKQLGLEVVGVEDGLEAVEQMLKRPPQLILLDLEMPRLDGLGVLTLMRKHKVLKDVPVIACTAQSERDEVMKVIKAGVNDFLLKPVDRRMLRERVSKFIPLNQTPLPAPANAEIMQPPAGPAAT